jgi:N-acetylmuramoyl-L-alanine amidase
VEKLMKSFKKFTTRRDFFRCLAKIGSLAALAVLPSSVSAASRALIHGMRLSTNRAKTRLVLDLNNSVNHSLFTLSNPERVVIDIRNSSFGGNLPKIEAGGLIKRIRSARRNGDDMRVVIVLSHRVQPKSFLLPPEGSGGHRLVIDLLDNRLYAGDKPVQKKIPRIEIKTKPLRDVIVAIDAGHGGKDPGATGVNRTREKNVTLAVAKKIKKALDKTHGIKAVLVRNRDVFMTLKKRIRIARQHKADLFVSIHADAYRNASASGASVYTLSNRGATSEAAQWIADKENAADLFGGVSIRNRSDVVAEILLDLAQSATIQSSLDLGGIVLKQLGQVGKVHRQKVEQAGFAVLRSPDIPSILIETAFISNPREEKKLRSKAFQEKLANAIATGVGQYFERQAPPGTILSGRSELAVS